MGPGEMTQVAALIARALRGRADDGAIAKVRTDVAALCRGFTPYP
jgi:glycine/serine hydroxymethyltransferase